MKPVSRVKAVSFILLLAVLWLFAQGIRGFGAETEDGEYEAVAEEYIKGYLGAHPLEGTALGLHEYDGKITDYSRLALDAELSRLRRFDDRLNKFDRTKLSPRQSVDLRILQAAVKKDLFEMQEMSVFERNPMVYARAADVNVYIKRNAKQKIRLTIMQRGWRGRSFRKTPWISRGVKKNSGASWHKRNSSIFLRKKSLRSAWSN